MTHAVLANYVASISDLKKHPMLTVETAQGEAIAILNHNEPVFYCVPAKMYEIVCEMLEDAELKQLIEARTHEKEIMVNLDEL